MLWQPVIDMLVPPSRRGPRDYCGRDLYTYKPGIYIRLSKRGLRGGDLAYEAGLVENRYLNFNVAAYAQHGTIEFRQHSGTLNPEKISNWVRFTELFMDPYAFPMDLFGPDHLHYAREKLDIPNEAPSSGVGIEHWVTEMILRLGGDEALATYYLARANSLAGRTSTDREDQQAGSFIGSPPDVDDYYPPPPDEDSYEEHIGMCTIGMCTRCGEETRECAEHICW
jgi:hypothetical protein